MGNICLRSIPVVLLSAALATPLPTAAQGMYRWTDDRGVVTYSNTPPPATSLKKVDKVEDRVSVYTPDEQTMRVVEQEAMGNKRAARLEAQKEAELRARNQPQQGAASVEAQRKAAYDRCVAERRVECDSILSGTPSGASYGYNSYYGPAYVFGGRVPPVPFAVIDPGPQTRVGESNAPRVGISTAPPVGISTAPKVGIDDRPPVGAPPRSRFAR